MAVRVPAAVRSGVLLALAGVLGAGCGYRFTAPGGPLPGGIRAVRAPVFANHTGEPAAETFFTEAFREELARAGTLGGEGTDAEVEGTLVSVGSGPLVSSPGRLPSYRLSATARLVLRRAGREVAATTVSGFEDYPPGADILLTEANRQAALRRVAQVLMRDGYERLCAGW